MIVFCIVVFIALKMVLKNLESQRFSFRLHLFTCHFKNIYINIILNVDKLPGTVV